VTATNRPRIPAAVLRDAATRLAGTVVLFVEDMTVGPAVYRERLAAFVDLDGADLGDDDGTVVNLLERGVTARDLIDEHGTPGAAAAYLTRTLRAAGVL
jgi:hypothetical protein